MDVSAFSAHLLPGERLQWSGQPRQGLLLVWQDLFLVPFSLLWGGMAIFGAGGAALSRPFTPFSLIGLLFVVVGIYITVGRFFHDAWIRSRTTYGLTDRRALIQRGSRFLAVDLKRVEAVELKAGAAGGGTIRFAASGGMAGFFTRGRSWGAWIPSLSDVPEFLAIEDASTVFRQIELIRARKD